MGVNPISAPLTRFGDIDRVGERLAIGDTALGDTDGTIVPSRLIEKHAMVVESTGMVKVVGRMNYEGIVRADGDRRGTRNLNKNGEEAEKTRENRRPSAVDANRAPWHT